MVHNLTDNKLALDRFGLLIESAPNAMLMVDQAGQILLVNSETEKLFGYVQEALVGQSVDILVPQRLRDGHPRHVATFFDQPTARALGVGRDLYAVRKDGTEFLVEIGLTPIRTEEGQFALSTIVDITERKRAERALRESEANLRDALHKLELQTSELQEANESLAQYAHVVSHDIRAPLRAIRNYADFLQEDLAGTLDQEQQEYLGGLLEAVAQSEQLAEDLLLLSQVERRGSEAGLLDIGLFLQDLIRSLQLPSDVQVTLATDWPMISADATLTRQIFQNLILNAVKFNESSPKCIELGCSCREDEQCEIYVRDNGIGIDPRHHEQILCVFHRLHNSDEYEGTGIGLAIVKKAVSKLGGTLKIQSEAGEGSTFVVQLPTRGTGSPA